MLRTVKWAALRDIVECSKFSDAKTLSLSDMVSIALPIDPRVGVDERGYR